MTGGRSFKNVTGYDFTHFLCGSEGMLGVFTEITLKLLPKPEAVRTLLAFYPDVEAAVGSVAQIIGNGIIPATLEIMDGNFLEAVDRLYGFGFPEGAGAALLIEVDGPEVLVGLQARAILDLCQKGGVLSVQAAATAEEREKLWKARRSGTAALVRQSKFLVTLDFSVPISAIAQAVREVQEIGRRYDLKVVVIGHAGDGNLHPLFIYDPDDPRQAEAYAAGEAELVRNILKLSGTLSGEHGIGIEKAHYLSLEKSPFELELSRRMKQAFDPKMIMNPGKCEWAAASGTNRPDHGFRPVRTLRALPRSLPHLPGAPDGNHERPGSMGSHRRGRLGGAPARPPLLRIPLALSELHGLFGHVPQRGRRGAHGAGGESEIPAPSAGCARKPGGLCGRAAEPLAPAGAPPPAYGSSGIRLCFPSTGASIGKSSDGSIEPKCRFKQQAPS